LRNALPPGQVAAMVTVQPPAELQHAPPHGLLGEQVVPRPWNAPAHEPEEAMEQAPDPAQHAPLLAARTVTV